MATTDTVMEHDVHEQQGEDWSGGKPPFKASYGKLMMWYFLLSDAFTFAGFLIVAQFVDILDTVGRKQHFSQGKEIDTLIKDFLAGLG